MYCSHTTIMEKAIKQMNRLFLKSVRQDIPIQVEYVTFCREMVKESKKVKGWMGAILLSEMKEQEIGMVYASADAFRLALESALTSVLEVPLKGEEKEEVVCFYLRLYRIVKHQMAFSSFLDMVFSEEKWTAKRYGQVKQMVDAYGDQKGEEIPSAYRGVLRERGVVKQFGGGEKGLRAFEAELDRAFLRAGRFCEVGDLTGERMKRICVGRYVEIDHETPLEIVIEMSADQMLGMNQVMAEEAPYSPDQMRDFEEMAAQRFMAGDVYLGYQAVFKLVGNSDVGFKGQVDVMRNVSEELPKVADGDSILVDFKDEFVPWENVEWDAVKWDIVTDEVVVVPNLKVKIVAVG